MESIQGKPQGERKKKIRLSSFVEAIYEIPTKSS